MRHLKLLRVLSGSSRALYSACKLTILLSSWPFDFSQTKKICCESTVSYTWFYRKVKAEETFRKTWALADLFFFSYRLKSNPRKSIPVWVGDRFCTDKTGLTPTQSDLASFLSEFSSPVGIVPSSVRLFKRIAMADFYSATLCSPICVSRCMLLLGNRIREKEMEPFILLVFNCFKSEHPQRLVAFSTLCGNKRV